jgi:hypothetical protein
MSFRGQRFAVLSLVVGLSMAAPMGAGSAYAAEPTAADVQWAQSILKAKGLYSGRANGDFNEPTRAALRAYQKSAGLKQTGQLDADTSGHMLAARQSTTQSTMGNLAGPNGKPQPSQTNRNVEPASRGASRGAIQAGAPLNVQLLSHHPPHAPSPLPAPVPMSRPQRRARPSPEVPPPENLFHRPHPEPASIPSVRRRRRECGKLQTRLKPASRHPPGCVR